MASSLLQDNGSFSQLVQLTAHGVHQPVASIANASYRLVYANL